MRRVLRCNKCGQVKRGHVCGAESPQPCDFSAEQFRARQHPLYPHLKGLVKRTWRALMLETIIAGETFNSIKNKMSTRSSGTMVGTLFELYFQRELSCLGLGLGFYMPESHEWTGGPAGNQLDVLHLSCPEWRIEIKTTRNPYVSQRTTSVANMESGYWLLSVRYNWEKGRNAITARFGWVEKQDWSRAAGSQVRLSDAIFWDNHVSVF